MGASLSLKLVVCVGENGSGRLSTGSSEDDDRELDGIAIIWGLTKR